MDLLDLFVKVGVKDEASSEIDALSGDIVGKLGSAAKTAAKLLAGAFAVKKVVDFGKSAYNAYSQFEQLAGGVAKLYGNAGQSIEQYAQSAGKSVADVTEEYQRNERAQAAIMQKAQEGWKTAGMSANQYMETATSFSASLINSLGGDTEKAAEMTDVAMRAMSDNVNTFGSDAQSVTNAFQGFAKQNYTMLDNLKLGYGGTKSEMQRLINDANKWGKENGKASDLTIDKFSDVVQAIQQIQEAQGIAGTTQKEALSTIEGSANAAKAAWQNLVTEIGKPDADLEGRISDLMDSVFGTVNEETNEREGGLLANASATMMRVGQGMAAAVPQAFSALSEAIPQAFNAILEKLPEGASTRLQGVYDVFEHIFEHISDKIDVDKLSEAFGKVADAFGGFMDRFGETADFGNIDVAIDKVFEIAEKAWGFIEQNVLPNLPALGELLGNVANFAMELANSILSVVNALAPFLPAILGAVAAIQGFMLIQTIIGFITTLGTTISGIIGFIGTFGGVIGTVAAFLGGWPVLIAAVIGAIVAFIATNDEAKQAIANAWETAKQVVSDALNGISEWIGGFEQSMDEAFTNFTDNLNGILEFIGGVFEAVGAFIEDPIGAITSGLSDVESSFEGLSGSTASNMASVEGSLEKGKKATKDYSNTPLKSKNATAKVTGNAVDGKAKKSAEDTQTAVSKLSDKSVSVNASGNIISGAAASAISGVVGWISSLRDKTVNVTTNQKTVKTEVGGAWGGITPRYHAQGGVRVADRYGAGEPLDVVGERGPEAIVPLTTRYGKEFAEMMGREAAKEFGGGTSVNIYLQYDASSDAKSMTMDIARELEMLGLTGV